MSALSLYLCLLFLRSYSNQCSLLLCLGSDQFHLVGIWMLTQGAMQKYHALHKTQGISLKCAVQFSTQKAERENDCPQDCYSKRDNCCSSHSAHTVVCCGNTYTLGGQPTLHWQVWVWLCQFHLNLLACKVSRAHSLPSHYYFVPVPREGYKGCMLMARKA